METRSRRAEPATEISEHEGHTYEEEAKMKLKTWGKCLATLIMLGLPAASSAMTSVYPTGTVKYTPEKCWNGFTTLAGGVPRMVDMNGNLVKEWKSGVNGFPAKPLPGGEILTTGKRWNGLVDDGITVSQLDWNEKDVLSFTNYLEVPVDYNDKDAGTRWVSTQHHDLQRKGNPVYYTPAVKSSSKPGVTLVLGHKWHKNSKISDYLLMDDTVYEVDENGNVIWEWVAADHFNEFGFDKAAKKALKRWHPAKGKEAKGFDWWHQNCASYMGPNKRYDDGDKRFHPDNIIFGSREANILCIIDHETGKVVWRMGPDYLEGKDSKVGQIIGPHNTHMIPIGLPGAGNIMVYDNGGQAGYGKPNNMSPKGLANTHRFYSRVLEIDPITREIVWEYSIKSLKGIWKLFGYKEFSPFISSAQRLPNGNTLICEGSNGRFIEVTKDLEVVWEYVSPYEGNIPGTNYVYRAYRTPYEWTPQVPRPREVAVVPPENGSFQIPNAEGKLPSVKSLAKAQVISGITGTDEGPEEEEEDEDVSTMPAY